MDTAAALVAAAATQEGVPAVLQYLLAAAAGGVAFATLNPAVPAMKNAIARIPLAASFVLGVDEATVVQNVGQVVERRNEAQRVAKAAASAAIVKRATTKVEKQVNVPTFWRHHFTMD